MVANNERYGDYEIERELGEGGMATTYRAWKHFSVGDRDARKLVCVKKIKSPHNKDEEFVNAFRNEAIRTAQLHHENVVQVNYFVHVDGQYFMELELIDGVDLSVLLDEHGTLDDEIIKHVAMEVAKALRYAHGVELDGGEQGMIHLDISPSNILLSRTGAVKLADFGIAKAVSSSVAPKETTNLGKLPYMAPERFDGQLRTDARADLFSLGVVLFECAAGKRPFGSEDDAAVAGNIIHGRMLSLEEEAPKVKPALREVIEGLLVTNREGRTESASVLLERLATMAPSVDAKSRLGKMVEPLAPPPPRPPRPRSPTTKKLTIVKPGIQAYRAGDEVALELKTEGKQLGPLTWEAENLPPGLNIDSRSGRITGVLRDGAVGRHNARISVTDGIFKPKQEIVWEIEPPRTWWERALAGLGVLAHRFRGFSAAGKALVLVSAALTVGVAGWGISKWIEEPPPPTPLLLRTPGFQTDFEGDIVSISLQVENAGDDQVVFSVTDLPPDLRIDPSTGEISGKLAKGAARLYQVEITAVAGDRTDTKKFGWNVGREPDVPDASVPDTSVPDAIVNDASTSDDTGGGGPAARGCLQVRVVPYAREVEVDGKPYRPGSPGNCMKMSATVHTVRARNPGEPWRIRRAKVPAGKRKVVQINMNP